MKTARDRLEFATGFANRDLDQLSPGHWMILRDDLCDFHGYGPRSKEQMRSGGLTLSALGGIMATPLVPPLPQDFPEDDFRNLQIEIRRLLGGLADSVDFSGKPAPISVFTRVPVTCHLAVMQQVGLSAQGPTRDMTLLRLAFLLAQNPGVIRRCPESECGQLFYRVRRKLYCSKQCVNRANKRDARAEAKKAASLKSAPATATAGKTRRQSAGRKKRR